MPQSISQIPLNPAYKRILVKISGEALQGKNSFGIDPLILNRIAREIKELIALDIQVSMVIGGGNLFRGASLITSGMNRTIADHIGMLSTIINGLAMYDALKRQDINPCLMSAIPIQGICDGYNWCSAIDNLCQRRVVVISGGTGNPFFTTDSAACLRGIELEVDIVLKATKVDGVYSADPTVFPEAKKFSTLTYRESIKQEFSIMDLTAFALARDHKLPICIFNLNKPGALHRIVMGKLEGTLIKD